ncbi:MAG: hypothetical protein QY323_05780 [Patescibacteria group bacterium]|nr:MAG: hypothetical protein QY323_05780 [Patescibacteria group bacterium]
MLREEIRKTEAELAELPADAPEHGFLKEKLRSYESQLAKLEDDMIEDMTAAVDPELRTPESYGVQTPKSPEIEQEHRNLDAMAETILEEERKRKAL